MLNKKGQSQFIFLAIFLLVVTSLLVIPVKNSTTLSLVISGEGDSAKVASVFTITDKKPYVELFSKRNDIGDYNLNITILDENRQVVLYGYLFNLDSGQSDFVSGSDLEGRYIAQTILYHNGKLVEPTKETKLIKYVRFDGR
ncbi:MAG: hypothetical protein AABX00_00675 [Nanoarchaeota archaeon]